MSRCCPVATTSRPPIPIATRSTKPIRPSWRNCALQALEDEIAFQGAGTIAAFIMEPVLGAGGVILPHESFMPGVEAICRKHGILLIADEVITAFGRTGAWTGSRLWGVKPDFACTAKAITNGYFPFGAVMISERRGRGVRRATRPARRPSAMAIPIPAIRLARRRRWRVWRKRRSWM